MNKQSLIKGVDQSITMTHPWLGNATRRHLLFKVANIQFPSA